MKIKITSDSSCDLSDGILTGYGITLFELRVILGDETYFNNELTPQRIFDYVAETNTLPKTAAGTKEEYAQFFEEQLKGYDALMHFNISSKASSCYNAACSAAKDFGGKVKVIDSRALSSGQGLLILKACDLIKQGTSFDETEKIINELRPHVNTSFVPDALDYLHKGGRCSLAALLGAKVMKLHPVIRENAEGQLIAKKKYMGNMERCIRQYVSDLREEYPEYDRTRCFITHSSADEKLVNLAKSLVSESFEFDEVIETVAGSIVSSHCGKGTLGVLFIAK